MRLTCLQENLSKGLNTVCKAISIKTPFPILSNVLLSAQDGRFKLAATNLDTTITTYVGASIERDGLITVPAKLFKELVSNLPPDTVLVDLVDSLLNVNVGRTTVKLNGVDAKEFPDIPLMPEKAEFLEVDPSVFVSAVNAVGFAAALDSSRPIFSGILLSFEKGILTLAASDGFRLSEKSLEVTGDLDAFSVVVPAKILLEVARVFSSSSEPLRISLDSEANMVLFESEDTLVTTRVLEGQFPDYKRIIPTESSLRVDFSAQDFLEAVRLASIFAQDEGRSIKLIFDPKGHVHVTSSSQESGEHKSSLEAVVEGEAVEVVVNSRYLLDFLGNAKVEQLLLETKGATNPCLLKPKDQEDFLHIIMPMQN